MAEKPTTKEEMETLARKLAATWDSHDAWLSLVRYGLATLLDDQPLLIELIIGEAVRQVKWSDVPPDYVPAEQVRVIMSELGLRFEVAHHG